MNKPTDHTGRESTLPTFLQVTDEGLMIEVKGLLGNKLFEAFIDRLFAGGQLLVDLDYSIFTKLLFDAEWCSIQSDAQATVRLAAGIGDFSADRKLLYRDIKIRPGGAAAEYFFEGNAPLVGEEADQPQDANLRFDEFVAHAWGRQIKYGLKQDVIEKGMHNRQAERVVVAELLEPVPGQDAKIEEVLDTLHVSNAPKIREDGKVDLESKANFFPQAKRGDCLLRKVERKLGKPGITVLGKLISPRLPKDVDINRFIGPGTCLEVGEQGEMISAVQDGFILIDEKSRKISVNEKIENKTGVSTKTTGSLQLDVEEYVEHGEIQEKRTIQGKHLTLMADVFGNVVSQGGDIRIAGNLSGGSAETDSGNINIEKRMSRAKVKALEGEVRASYADTSCIVAKVLKIEHAINCELVADTVIAGQLEGCLVIAREIKVKTSTARRTDENRLVLLTPDLTELTKQIDGLQRELLELEPPLQQKQKAINKLKQDPEFVKFLNLYDSVKSNKIKLVGNQAASWKKLVEQHAINFKKMAKLSEEGNVIYQQLKQLKQQQQELKQQREQLDSNVGCEVKQVIGETQVLTLSVEGGLAFYADKSAAEMRDSLIKGGHPSKSIFAGSSGKVSWTNAKQKPQDEG